MMQRNRGDINSTFESDSATSSEIGDITEADDCDFLEFLGDWSENIIFKGVADEIEYGETPSTRFRDESASFKKRRLEENNSALILNSTSYLLKISSEEKAPTSSSSSQQRKSSSKNAFHNTSINRDATIQSIEDAKLVGLPEKLYQAFNGGNLKLVSQIIAGSFSPDCIFQTMLMDTPLIGRQHVYNFFEAFTVSHPDIVFITKNPKIMQDVEGKCLKFKFVWTGTNVFPREAKHYYFEQNGNLIKYLDVSKVNKKELTTMKSLAVRVRASGTPYASVGRGLGTFGLNEKNEIISFRVNWRLLSIRDPSEDDRPNYEK